MAVKDEVLLFFNLPSSAPVGQTNYTKYCEENTRGGYKSWTLVGRKKNAIMDEKAKSVDVGSMHGDQIMPRGANEQGWAEPDPVSASIGLGLGLMFECSG